MRSSQPLWAGTSGDFVGEKNGGVAASRRGDAGRRSRCRGRVWAFAFRCEGAHDEVVAGPRSSSPCRHHCREVGHPQDGSFKLFLSLCQQRQSSASAPARGSFWEHHLRFRLNLQVWL